MAETFVPDAGAPGAAPPTCAAAPAPASPTAGQRLHLAGLRMAGRLAALLEELEPASQKATFLRLLAGEAGPDAADGSVLSLPAATEVQPVDRVAARLGLDALDLDLLVLAGLPGEREGLASVLRDLHPEHRPVATGGLAAALAEAGLIGGGLAAGPPVVRRETVRERLAAGVLGRSGVVRLDRAAPFSEAAIVPGPAVWEALRGEDLWPPACRPWAAPGCRRRPRRVVGHRDRARRDGGVPPPRSRRRRHRLRAAVRGGSPPGRARRAGREDRAHHQACAAIPGRYRPDRAARAGPGRGPGRGGGRCRSPRRRTRTPCPGRSPSASVRAPRSGRGLAR